MAALSVSIDEIRPMNRWDHDSIRPGNVSSVGDVNMAVRMKQSSPDMMWKFDPKFYGKNEERVGSNSAQGYNSVARVVDSNWGGRRDFKIRRGWVCQDIRAPDKKVEPYMGQTGNSWNNRIATMYDSKRTGDQFLPLPGGYSLSPGELPRGGNFPTIADQVGIEDSFADSIVSGMNRAVGNYNMPVLNDKGVGIGRNNPLNAGQSRFGRQPF